MIRSSKHNDSVRRMGPAVAMVAAAIVLALCLPYRASAQGGFSGPGQYEITNTRSGMVLEIDRNDQSSVMQSASRGTNSQVWEVRDADSGFYYLQNIVNGYALESVGTGNGARAIATRFNGRANQQWRFDTSRNGDALIISRLGNMLDIQGMTGSERARVYQGNGSSGQQFRFRQLSPNFNDSWSVNRDGNYNDNNRSGENRLTIERNNNISWETQGIANARVYTQRDNGREQLFAQGRSGTQSASWIERGHLYVFILRDVNGAELARNQVDLRSSSASNQSGYPGNNGSGAQRGRQYPGNWGSGSVAQGRYIGAGATISVRTNEPISARNSDGRVFTGVVDQDVPDGSGNIAIPRGSDVELVVKNLGNNDLTLDLESVTVSGQRYGISTEDSSLGGGRRDSIGANKRTGEYVGGGALLGAIIGAIAGGGKGAAIGAGAGAAAGVGTQILTRGKNVNVPAESLLTFRLDQPLQMAAADNGVTRNGRHYHDQAQ